MLNLLKSLRSKKPAERRARPQLETLEARDVPTIAFTNTAGETGPIQGGANVGMQNPTVNFIFSGPYWYTPNGQYEQNIMLDRSKSLLAGPYLSGLKQYGTDGKATFGSSWADPTTTTNQNLQSFVQSNLDRTGAWLPAADQRHAPIYVVVSDPTSSDPRNEGWYGPGSVVHSSVAWENRWNGPKITGTYYEPRKINMVHIGTHTNSVGLVEWDDYTNQLSSQLVGIIAHPTPDAATVSVAIQLEDSYRLNGIQVMSAVSFDLATVDRARGLIDLLYTAQI